MTRAKRKRLLENIVVGIALTLLIVGSDWGGYLISAERLLGDRRARLCQFWQNEPAQARDQPSAPPLLHLDIDDNALEEIERWPWPRAIHAEILEEINRANPRLVALDIQFSEQEEPTISEIPGEGDDKARLRKTDHDAMLAAALKDSGRSLLPVRFDFAKLRAADDEEEQLHRQIAAMFDKDLMVTSEAVGAALAAQPQGQRLANDPVWLESACAKAQREALLRRIRDRVTRSEATFDFNQLWQELDPNETLSPTLQAPAQVKLARIQALQMLSGRFTTDAKTAGNTWNLLKAIDTIPPIPRIASVASGSGFINYLPSDDGILRGVPLCVVAEGRVFPQFGMAIACAVRNGDVRSMNISPEMVTVPCSDGTLLQIPVRAYRSKNFGAVDTFFEVPLHGTSDWTTMYDQPRHQRILCHAPVTLVWHLVLARKGARNNNAEADRRMSIIAAHTRMSIPNFSKYRFDPDDRTLRAQDAAAMCDVARRWLSAPAPTTATTTAAATADDDAAADADEAREEVQEARQFLVDVLEEMKNFDKHERNVHEKLNGRVVIIGSTATGIGDFVPTSLHPQCPGVVIHGAIYNAIVTGNMYQYAPGWFGPILTMISGLIATVTVAFEKIPWRAFAICMSVLVGYLLANGLGMFDYANWIAPLAGPVVAILMVWLGLSLLEWIVETAQRRFITRRFQTYVDPKLVEFVLEHPEHVQLEGQVKELTIVYTDLAGFTSLAEKLREDSVKVLNRYLARMVPVLRRRENKAYLNKFLGDGMLFFFGAPIDDPDHAENAVRTVLELHRAMPEFNRQLVANGLPAMSMRAGINTGEVVVGDAGTSDASDYTVIGDNSNLGARLESANKEFGTRILVSNRTRELAGDGFLFRAIGKIRVVGRLESVMVHEPLSIKSDATASEVRMAKLTDDMVNAFLDAHFEACIEKAIALNTEFGPSKLTELYIQNCKTRAVTGIDSFDGVLLLAAK